MLFCLMNYEDTVWLVNVSFTIFLLLVFVVVFKVQEDERLDVIFGNKD